MSNFANTPLSELGPRDAADGLNMGNVSPLQLVPADENYALDEATVRMVKDEVVPIVRQTRYDRRSMEAVWQAIRRMANMRHDDGQAYIGQSNVYLPIHAKNRQSLVSAMSRSLFPSDDYMDVMAIDQGDLEKAKNLKLYLQYEFEIQAKLRLHMKLFLSQLMDYGFSVFKCWYQKAQPYGQARNKKVTLKNLVDGMSTESSDYETEFYRSSDEGFRVSARNIFNFHVYPFTAATLDDTTLQFEDVQMSLGQLREKFVQGEWLRWEEVQKAYKDGRKTSSDLDAAPRPYELQPDYSALFGDHDVPTSSQLMGTELGDIRTVTEVFTFLQLPKSAYTGADSPDCPLPVRIILINEEPVLIKRNPYYHQKSPFFAVSLNASPGFYYGYGPGHQVRPLQYLANDFANQTNDNCIYSLNPIVIVNPSLLTGPLRPIRPGVTWTMNSVNEGVKFDRPPFEQVGMGLQMLSTITGQAQDFEGAPPVLQGLNDSKNAKTATGAQILQYNARQPLQDVAEDIETQVLVQAMEMAWHLGMQYRSEKTLVSVFGVSKEIARDDLMFEAKMRWLASSQSVNAQLRSQQAMQFLQMVLSPAVLQTLMQQGYQVNPVPLLQRTYSDGFGFRGFEEFIKKAPMAPPGMGGMPPAGMSGAAASLPPEGDRIRSAAEQAPMGGIEATPGEGQDFMNVRQGADQMAAMIGSMGMNPYEGEGQ